MAQVLIVMRGACAEWQSVNREEESHEDPGGRDRLGPHSGFYYNLLAGT